jgi:hypothetical protein
VVQRIGKNNLTNRGAAGLYRKLTDEEREAYKEHEEVEGTLAKVPTPEEIIRSAKKNKISPGLAHMVVDIDSLVPDPENAREHGEDNMEAIKLSLAMYGQVKPVVVREQNRVIAAGNGTTRAAKALGWTKIAANFVRMTDADFVGYALADNRTAELAKWNYENLQKHAELLSQCGHAMAGWNQDTLLVIRAAEWTPVVVPDDTLPENRVRPIEVTKEQREAFDNLAAKIRAEDGNKDLTDGAILALMMSEAVAVWGYE